MRAIAGYELLGELGRGGMGVVHRARDPRLGREVAIKLLPAGGGAQEARARFRREAETLARLEHPQIVRVHTFGEEGGQLYLVMDLVPGVSLDERLARGALPASEAVELVRKLAQAVAAAHRVGVVHRDLKPANVLIDPRGEPRLLDFGLARLLDASGGALSKTGQLLGTPGYWSPEQAGGERQKIDERTDVYGLGALLYVALTGKPPADAGSFNEAVIAARERVPDPPSRLAPGISSDLDATCMCCLAKDPAQRYPSADALVADLDRIERGARSGARGGSRGAPLARLAAGIAALGILAAGGIVFSSASSSSLADGPELLTPVIELTAPADGLLVFKQTIAVEGRLSAGSGPCEIRVGDAKKRVRPEAGKDDFRFSVRLREGLNTLTVEVLDVVTGIPGQAQNLTVAYHEAPEWFQVLPEDQRPRLPLPPGLSFQGREGEYVNRQDGSVLVYVPPGSFVMGSDDEPEAEQNRKHHNPAPCHQVTLTRGYFIGKFEVSWGQLERFCAETQRALPNDEGLAHAGMDPAFTVSWELAQAYCEWAGLRLPTEAEWEFAARGPESFEFPWGNDPDAGQANTGSGSGVVPVDSMPLGASPFGALHMAGNVAEWVYDTYRAHPAEPQVDPVSFVSGKAHVLKNSAWAAPIDYCRTYIRWQAPDSAVRTDHGFRVARSAD